VPGPLARSADGSPVAGRPSQDSVWDVLQKSPRPGNLKTLPNAVMQIDQAGENGYSAVVRRAVIPKPAAPNFLKGPRTRPWVAGGASGFGVSQVELSPEGAESLASS